MKRTSPLILCVLLAGSISLLAKDKPTSFTGWVSDEHCGATHTKPGGADCVRKCLRGSQAVGHPEGKPPRAVIVADGDNRVWIVANPAVLKDLEGEHVRVTGYPENGKNSIRVLTVVSLGTEEEK